MRFVSIDIHNYRQYKDIHFDFPKVTACDMHIIEASNGVGKTNLLNAINWCLYGDEPHLTGSDNAENHFSEALPICNLDSLEAAQWDGDLTVPVTVKICGENTDGQFEFKRTARFNVNTGLQVGVDDIEIRKYPISGDMELFSGKEATLPIVDQYMPKRIREYFYFDGERLLNYLTNADSKTSNIRDSIYQIAGVVFVNRSIIHLQDLIKENSNKISKLSPDLEAKEKALESAKKAVEDKIKDIDDLSDQIAIAEREIAEANKKLDGTEASREANAKYNANRLLIDQNKMYLAEAKDDLVDFVHNYFSKLMLYKINKSTLDYINEREAQSAIKPEVNINAIKNSLDNHKCDLCTQEIPHDIEEELRKLLISYEANASMQKLKEIQSDIKRSLYIDDYIKDKEKIFSRIRSLEESIESLEDENDDLYKSIEIIGDMKGLELIANSKKENEELREKNIEKRGSYRNKLIDLKRAQEDRQKEYEDALKKNKECGEIRVRYEVLKTAEEIVSSVRDEILADIKIKMENETKRIFDDLLWKKDTYGRVELDDNFRLQLYHKRSGQSCLYSCSAAEKELLALSFTIALQNISGYDNMLFIDTPVGRVSDANRENFAKVLLSVSQNKQIILAFTPSEYSKEISSVLNKNVISSFNRLYYDEDKTTKED